MFSHDGFLPSGRSAHRGSVGSRPCCTCASWRRPISRSQARRDPAAEPVGLQRRPSRRGRAGPRGRPDPRRRGPRGRKRRPRRPQGARHRGARRDLGRRDRRAALAPGRSGGRARPWRAERRRRLGGGAVADLGGNRAVGVVSGLHDRRRADRRRRHLPGLPDPDRRRHGRRPGVRAARRLLRRCRLPPSRHGAAVVPRAGPRFPARDRSRLSRLHGLPGHGISPRRSSARPTTTSPTSSRAPTSSRSSSLPVRASPACSASPRRSPAR